MFPVYIPSKGRADTCSTARLLIDSGIRPMLVVEPQDQERYRELFTNSDILVLPCNDNGLPLARNFILDHARSIDCDWFWMIDDDVTWFSEVQGNKCVKSEASQVLWMASDLIQRSSSVAQASLEYQQFAWSAGGRVTENSYCDVVVAINVKRTKAIRYRDSVALKEDRDFTLQVLASGWNTNRLTRFAFSCPKNGSNRGGLSPLYAINGREEQVGREMVRLWGSEVCRFNRKSDGRPDVKINWRFFKR